VEELDGQVELVRLARLDQLLEARRGVGDRGGELLVGE
jgi:hypothetical protein